MIINILKSKLHRATITDVHLDYEGSCAIDANILQASGINEYEMIQVAETEFNICYSLSINTIKMIVTT